MIKKKKKGSTLVLVLIFFSILMIIGTALMSLALSSYKMRRFQGDATRAFYIAESGIEQGYNIVMEVADEAKIEEARLIEEKSIISNNEDKGKENENKNINGNGESSEIGLVAVYIYVSEIGSKVKEYIENNLGGANDRINTLKDENKSNYDSLFNDGLEVIVEDVSAFEGGNIYTVSVKSTGKFNNIKKVITADYHIEYNYNSNIKVEIVNFKEN